LAIGYWLLAIGYWLLAIGYWLLAIGYWLVLNTSSLELDLVFVRLANLNKALLSLVCLRRLFL